MGCCKAWPARRLCGSGHDRRGGRISPDRTPVQADCLEQLLEAFCDIIDRDDIHQAARRLVRVLEWIRDETKAAADDPIFADLPAGLKPSPSSRRRYPHKPPP
jgi:hypothetical protein